MGGLGRAGLELTHGRESAKGRISGLGHGPGCWDTLARDPGVGCHDTLVRGHGVGYRESL